MSEAAAGSEQGAVRAAAGAEARASGAEPSRAALRAKAERLDAADRLAAVRGRFVLEPGPEPGPAPGGGGAAAGQDAAEVYLDGNSLGLLPRGVPGRLDDVVRREWGALRIRSWEQSGWWDAPERIGDRVAPLVGAAPGQVVVGDSTSVNVFKALVAAVRMADADAGGAGAVAGAGAGAVRDEILVDAATFPSDGYIAESAARLTGRTLRPVAPGDLPGAVGPRTAAVLVNHVDYRTGRQHDLPRLTAAVHEAGAYVVWDLCHSAGALPVGLDAHGVDLAVGCTYKFLNGGPGAPAFLYVRRDLQPRFDSPLPGWNSHEAPFGMRDTYVPARGAARGRVGTPDILSMLALDAALDVWEGVTVDEVRAKSLALTDFFTECVRAYAPAGSVEVITPAAYPERGSQVSLRTAPGLRPADADSAGGAGTPVAGAVMERLIARGVVGDFRPPDVLRFGFTPLYLGFAETERAADVLARVLGEFMP